MTYCWIPSRAQMFMLSKAERAYVLAQILKDPPELFVWFYPDIGGKGGKLITEENGEKRISFGDSLHCGTAGCAKGWIDSLWGSREDQLSSILFCHPIGLHTWVEDSAFHDIFIEAGYMLNKTMDKVTKEDIANLLLSLPGVLKESMFSLNIETNIDF